MTISVGDTLPAATFLVLGEDGGPKSMDLADVLVSGKGVIFGLPGAFTRTCTAAHLPSFIRTRDQFAAKGFESIACVAVNDPFVMGAWSESTGAKDAGIHMLADPGAEFIKAIGLEFTAPPVGFFDRSKRFVMAVVDGKVTVLNVEDSPGECGISAGESLLDLL